MGLNKFRNCFQSLLDFIYFWPLWKIHSKSLSVVKLRWQESICKANFISHTKLALWLFQKSLKCIKSFFNCNSGPIFFVPSKLSNSILNTQILYWLSSCVDNFTKSPTLKSLNRVTWQHSLSFISMYIL